MIKKIAIVLVCLIILAALCFAGWWFFLKPTPLLGSIDNAHRVSCYLGEHMYYNVWVPNEAVLIETDEASIYKYDLLTIGVQDTEPLTDYKVQVNGRWVYAESEDKWLLPTAHGFETEKPYEASVKYEYSEYIDPETGEHKPYNWADGPAPTYADAPEGYTGGTQVWQNNSYILTENSFLRWDDAVEEMLIRLGELSGDYIPHYYNDGNILYAEDNGYVVGIKYVNFNTQKTIVAHGDKGIAAALNILTEG